MPSRRNIYFKNLPTDLVFVNFKFPTVGNNKIVGIERMPEYRKGLDVTVVSHNSN